MLRKTLIIFAPWIAILALLLLIMAPGLRGEFFFDDNPNIVQNSNIQIKQLTLASLKSSISGPAAGPFGRPVSVLSFALTHYFFGLNAFAFKAINLAIHALNGLLVACFLKLLLQLFNPPLSQQSRLWIPVWVAAIWLIHPINFVPIMLAVQRMSLLSGTFMLLGLIGYLKYVLNPEKKNTKWIWLGASWFIFWPLSILSKETGLLFPLYVLTLALLSPSTGQKNRNPWIVPASICILAGVAIVQFTYLGWGWLETAYVARPFSLGERLLTETRVLWFYVAQIVFPRSHAFGLYLDDFALSRNFLEPVTTIFAIIGWISVIAAVFLYRRSQPILCLSIGWFLVGHSLESSFLPLEIAQEYRNYLPSIGLILGVAYLGSIFLQRTKQDYPIVTASLAAALPLFVLALFTWLRADQLSNPLLSTQIEAARHPQSARANYSAAVALIQSGYGDKDDPIGAQQIQYFLKQSSDADPTFKYGDLSMIIWSCASNRQVEKKWIESLAARLQHSPYTPRDLEMPAHLLKPLLSMPKCLSREDALKLFSAGAENPRISNLLKAHFLEAASDYELLVSLDPQSAQNYLAKATTAFPYDSDLNKKLKDFQVFGTKDKNEQSHR